MQDKDRAEISEELIKFLERNQDNFEYEVDFTEEGKLLIILYEI